MNASSLVSPVYRGVSPPFPCHRQNAADKRFQKRKLAAVEEEKSPGLNRKILSGRHLEPKPFSVN